ncbi:MAG: 50S ribosomal protein L25 [Anaerolineaceae bacterium]|jgi:large subunit ribosomal protein L25
MTHEQQVIIKAEKRKVTGKKVAQLRREGKLPGVVYGRHLEKTIPIQMDAHSTSLILGKLTGSSLLTLDFAGEKLNVIVRDRQRDVIFGRLMHVDFLAVSMTEKLRTTVGIELVGEAPVLKLMECFINQGLQNLEIEALPADLPERIEVDVTGIETADDIITVGDLKLGDKVEVLTPADEVVASVGFAAVEPEPTEEEVSDEPEVLEKGKKEEDEESEE